MPAPARRKSRRLPRPGSRPSLQSKVVRALCNGTAARHWTVAGSGCHCPAMWPTNLAVWGALALILKGRMAPQSLKLNLVPRTQILGLFDLPKKRFCVFTPNYLSNKLLMLYSCVLFLLFTIACIPIFSSSSCFLSCLVLSALWYLSYLSY